MREEVLDPPVPDLDEAPTHHEIARNALAALRTDRGNGEDVVATEGAFFVWAPPHWRALEIPEVEVFLGERFNVKGCKTKTQYKGIAQHMFDMVRDPLFFESAAVGVQTPTAFYRVSSGGIERTEGADPADRQRYALQIEPDPNCRTDTFDVLLDQALRVEAATDDGPTGEVDEEATREQQRLLQEFFGAALTGEAAKHERALLLHGKGGSGKSTLLRILVAMVPPALVSAVSPFRWFDDYQLSLLAGSRINIVGELPPDKAVPQAFKSILGRDSVTAREPYRPPFTFRPSCAHLFSSNHFLQTRDQTDGFWRRWLCVACNHPVAPEDREPDLDKHIIEGELPGVLHWALEGAERVARTLRYSHSRTSDRVIEQWRKRSDAVAEFFDDPEVITHRPDADEPKTAVYKRFKAWCRTVERKPMSAAEFYHRTELLGYRLKKIRGERCIEGVRLLEDPDQPLFGASQ
jgi:putative DNA primase/helicase